MRGWMGRCAAAIAALVWAAAASAQTPNPRWPNSLVIGTASQGGLYNTYGEALARILTRELRIPVTTRVTQGPSENITLLEAGEIQLAFVTLGTALQGWNGAGEWAQGKQHRALRALFPMYDSPFQFVVKADSPIQSIADLAGKRVGVGPRLGTAGLYLPGIMQALKVQPALVNGEWSDLGGQLAAGQIDALAVSGGAPFPALTSLETKGPLRYLPLSEPQMVSLRLAMPELSASSVAAYTYPSLTAPYRTLGMYNFAVAHRDLPGDLVYAIVDTVFSQQPELVDRERAAAETVPANFTRNTFLPYHQGASDWYANKTNIGIGQGD